MTAVNCPLCQLRFASKNERDWHLRDEHGSHHIHHPITRHEPGRPAPAPSPEPADERTP
jgi:hypothetical protein